jgi:hypothetical protein
MVVAAATSAAKSAATSVAGDTLADMTEKGPA